jgi:hypothetical protein
MAHFAQIDSDSIVTNVLVIADSDAPNEAAGIAFCQSLIGADTSWVQTSYTGSIRFRFAGIGMKYDSTNDVFYHQQPYPSWILVSGTWAWEPPVYLPSDSCKNEDSTQIVTYTWDENSTSWNNRTVTDLT